MWKTFLSGLLGLSLLSACSNDVANTGGTGGAPVVAPAGKSFLVFFDWDKSTLTFRARRIIREAAATSKTTQHTKIEVNGYADTSGKAEYNKGISMRRAQRVAAELVRNGVAKGEIAIKAFGDTVLLVPTGPGVREPQNRRVEIIIR